jgi:hypothetical protein
MKVSRTLGAGGLAFLILSPDFEASAEVLLRHSPATH